MRWLMSALAGVLLALGVMRLPYLTVAVVIGAVFLLLCVYTRLVTPNTFFLVSVGVLLVGYAFFGRAFAYIGIPPVYIGELVLAIGVGAAMLGMGLSGVLRSPVSWLLIAFVTWGAVCTVPYVGTYGMYSLRDAVVWGYSAFAMFVGASLLDVGAAKRIPSLYRRIVPSLLVWIPIAIVVANTARNALPHIPGTDDIRVLEARPMDMAAQLAGATGFLLLGMFGVDRSSRAKRGQSIEWICWLAWVVGFVVVASQSRAGLASVAVTILVVLSLRPSARWWKAAVLSTGVVVLSLFLNVEFDLGKGRAINPKQIGTNLLSITDNVDQKLEGTKSWRLQWWRHIIKTSLERENFWMGKGYGINLAVDFDEDFVDPGGGKTRSPHNSHLTILARSGVPGFALWLILQCAFAVSLLRAFLRARSVGDEGWGDMYVWLLSFWAALMVNMSFSVFLESPQVGIWYWSLFGFGLAAMEAHRRELGNLSHTEIRDARAKPS